MTRGQAREPVHRRVICVPDGKRLARSSTLRVRVPTPVHFVCTLPVSGGNGATSPSQFSSTSLPIPSAAPGCTEASSSLQSCGSGVPSWSRSVITASKPGAVLVDAVARDVDGAGVDGRVGVVAVGRVADAVAVRVALHLLTRDAHVRVVGDRRVMAVAAVDLLEA